MRSGYSYSPFREASFGDKTGEGGKESGIGSGIWEELYSVLFLPSRFFSSENLKAKKHPGIFLFLVVYLSSMFSGMWTLGFRLIRASSGEEFILLSEYFAVVMIKPLVISLAIMFLARITAAVSHLGLRLTGNMRGNAWMTYSAACYAGGASIFLMLPFIGGVTAWIWGTGLFFIGLKRVHGVGFAGALLSVCLGLLIFITVLPLLLFLAILLLVAIAAVTVGFLF